MNCPMDWFFFMEEAVLRDISEEEREAAFRRLRERLPETLRKQVIDFLTVASQAANEDLYSIECPEVHNGYVMVSEDGQPLRLVYQKYLRKFLDDAPGATS